MFLSNQFQLLPNLLASAYGQVKAWVSVLLSSHFLPYSLYRSLRRCNHSRFNMLAPIKKGVSLPFLKGTCTELACWDTTSASHVSPSAADNITARQIRAVPWSAVKLGELGEWLGNLLSPQPTAIQTILMTQCWAVITYLLLLAGGVKLVICNSFHGCLKYFSTPAPPLPPPLNLTCYLLASKMQQHVRCWGPWVQEAHSRNAREDQGTIRPWRTVDTAEVEAHGGCDKMTKLNSCSVNHPRSNQPWQAFWQISIDDYWNLSS